MIDLLKAVKALSDETRLRMINLLLQKECCVCEVIQVLKISQTRASRNLNLLRDAGFLSVRKDGLWSYYSIIRKSHKEPSSFLLDAVARGLKADPIGLKDLKNLKKTRRLRQQSCSK
jgi:ArsR family transcriptional regulator, arsenate/arsenite/antimonite-responsive transcriptional repressor